MKFLVVFAVCVAAASAFVVPPIAAGVDAGELQQIIDAIYHPSTDPATAAALEQMLFEVLGIAKPEPVIVPEEVGFEPIDVLPAIIDESIVSEPANYQGPPLVQVIIKVNPNMPANAVVVDQPKPEIVPGEVIVVEQPEPEIVPGEVIVVEQPEIPEPVIVAPIEPIPVINLPGILN